jgi:hypothetical protein
MSYFGYFLELTFRIKNKCNLYLKIYIDDEIRKRQTAALKTHIEGTNNYQVNRFFP